jgi:hypothetical protein
LAPQVAHLFNLQASANLLGCHDVQVGVIGAGDQAAGTAHAAGGFSLTLA